MNKTMLFLFSLSSLLLSGLVQAEGSVTRAIVTTGVTEREPINDLERVMAGNKKVLFFTELRNLEGQTVKHRWSRDGEVLAEVEFNVGGPRWRVWSSKNLIPEWAGEWHVAVVDSEGAVMSEKRFEFAAERSSVESATPEESTEKVMAEEAAAEAEAAAPQPDASE